MYSLKTQYLFENVKRHKTLQHIKCLQPMQFLLHIHIFITDSHDTYIAV